MANIYNEKALDFYKKHGAKDIEPAYETEHVHDEECVLISKHCLRYCFNLCPKRHKVTLGHFQSYELSLFSFQSLTYLVSQ